MVNLIKFFKLLIVLGALANCSQVLQTVELQLSSEDSSTQEQFNVIEKTLTVREARKQNSSPYKRFVLQAGRGNAARSIRGHRNPI